MLGKCPGDVDVDGDVKLTESSVKRWISGTRAASNPMTPGPSTRPSRSVLSSRATSGSSWPVRPAWEGMPAGKTGYFVTKDREEKDLTPYFKEVHFLGKNDRGVSFYKGVEYNGKVLQTRELY